MEAEHRVRLRFRIGVVLSESNFGLASQEPTIWVFIGGRGISKARKSAGLMRLRLRFTMLAPDTADPTRRYMKVYLQSIQIVSVADHFQFS